MNAYFPRAKSGNSSSGIDITYFKTKQELCIGGWYDSFVGIESDTVTLIEFFTRLGITENDCKKAFKSQKQTA